MRDDPATIRARKAEPSAYSTKVGRPAPLVRVPAPIVPEVMPSDDRAFKAAVGAFAKAIYEDENLAKGFLNGNAAQMPGSSWSNQGTINNSLIARVTQNLASSFGKAPAELEVALAEHGLTWGPPFPPGRPLDPFFGYRRPPRTQNYAVGENVQLTPRWNRIAYSTLKAIIESYYAAQICVRHLVNDVRSLDYQFIPPSNVLEDATDDIAKAEEFFASPDKRQPFRGWLAEYLQDVLRYDAGTLYIRRNNAGEPIALEVVDGTTMIPLIDYYGRPPADEDDATAIPEGIWQGDVTPAFLQIIEGLPWDWLALDDIIYQRLNPLPESQYGLAPMEAVLLQANTDIRFQWHFLQYFCYDDQTEVLTRDGWRSFDDVDGSEEFATRSADGRFEWQHTNDGTIHQFDYEGDLVHFSSRNVDCMVTPNHRMLVRIAPSQRDGKAEYKDWHIRRADHFVGKACRAYQVPVASEWSGGDEPEAPCGMDSWAWARFLGIFLAEGCLERSKGELTGRVFVSQSPTHTHWAEVADILVGTGLEWSSSGNNFYVRDQELAEALVPCGHLAPNKVLPREVLDWSVKYLDLLLDSLCLGDGSIANGEQQTYSTTSSVLAGQLQEIWQKLGVCAVVSEGDNSYRGNKIYRVGARKADAYRLPSPTLEHYKGKVSCVSVPNGIVYVRRNGKAMWCGNTQGSIPAGFMEAPPDLSDPLQVEQWQAAWDAVMYGDQGKLRETRWVPAGSKWTPVKSGDFNDAFPLYLMRCTCAAFGVTPNDLGFTENVNRSTGEIQVDVQFRVGTLPIVRHVEDVINLFILEHLNLKARIAFDTGQGTQHRLETAQANKIYVDTGVLSQDEVRMSLGKRISRENPTSRYINNARAGAVPIGALYQLAGDIDPTTYAPKKGQDPNRAPFFSAPGTAPVIGSVDYKTAMDATANMQRAMLGLPPLPPPPQPALGPAKPAAAAKDSYTLAEVRELLETLPYGGSLKGIDNTGGPGVTRGFSDPTAKTEGITAATGAQGVDLIGVDDDEDEDWPSSERVKVEKTLRTLRQWKENSLRRVRKGLPPRQFSDLPDFVTEPIWARLESAVTSEDVRKAFAGDCLNPKAPARKGQQPKVAGLALVAKDSGRVVMVQRANKHG